MLQNVLGGCVRQAGLAENKLGMKLLILSSGFLLLIVLSTTITFPLSTEEGFQQSVSNFYIPVVI